MIIVKIDRKTGKTISVERSNSPADQGMDKMAAIVAKWAIRTGRINVGGIKQ